MKIERKNSQESMTGQFPQWRDGKVVEIFQYGVSHGLYMMCHVGVGGTTQGQILFSLGSGCPWSISGGPFDKADYAIEVKGKFVEE